ncbi:hypothetical protein Sste5344_006871 [Sporothrix stenoceras]
MPVHASRVNLIREGTSEGQSTRPTSRDSDRELGRDRDIGCDVHRSSSPAYGSEAVQADSASLPPVQKESTTAQDDKLLERANTTTNTADKPIQDVVMSDADLPPRHPTINTGCTGLGSLPPKPPKALNADLKSFSSPIMGSSHFPMAASPTMRVASKPSNSHPTIQSSPVMPSLMLPAAPTLTPRAVTKPVTKPASKPPVVDSSTATADSLNAIFGTTHKSSSQLVAFDVTPATSALVSVSNIAITSSPTSMAETTNMEIDPLPVALPSAAEKANETAATKDGKDTKDTKDTSDATSLAKSTTVYKARRTPSESKRRMESARYNAILADRMKKPEVPNFVGALASAAIASALGSRPTTDAPLSPSLSTCSAASSPMFVSTDSNKRGEQTGQSGNATDTSSAAVQERNARVDTHNPLGIVNTTVTTVTTVASLAPRVEDKPSSRNEIPEQFVLPDYLRMKQEGRASSPVPAPKVSSTVSSTLTPDSVINAGKKHARRSSSSADEDSAGELLERPRKRVSFGLISYDNPEYQPMSPAQVAQTKRKSSLSISSAGSCLPSPEKQSAKTTSSPVKANRNSSATGKSVDRLQKPPTSTTQSPPKAQITLSQQLLLTPVKFKPTAPKPQIASAKAQVTSTPAKSSSLSAKSSAPQGETQAPLRKLAPAKSHVASAKLQSTSTSSKPLASSVKPQAMPSRRLPSPPPRHSSPPPVKKSTVQNTSAAVPAKARHISPAPVPAATSAPSPASASASASASAILQHRVQGNRDNETVLCDLRVREPLPTPQYPVAAEVNEDEHRAVKAQAVLEFIKAQTAAHLDCLQPLLSASSKTSSSNSSNNSNNNTLDNNMLQCNLEAVKAQLDALDYASRAALDRIKVKQKLQQMQELMQGQLLLQQNQQQQEKEQPHHHQQQLPPLRDKENETF